MSARTVLRVNAGVVLAIGMALSIPLLLSLLYRDGSWRSFLFPAAALIVVGGVAIRATRPSGHGTQFVSKRDVYLSVTLAWTLAALLGGMPFLIEGTLHSLIASSSSR